MPNFPWSGRRDVSGIEDTALAALLAGMELPADAAAGLRLVADVLAALRAGPAGDELAGAAAALAEFRHRVGVSGQQPRSRRRRPTMLTSLLRAKAAAVAAIAAITLGGAATAAFAGALPNSLQQFAHHTIGAPAPHSTASRTPVGPNAAGEAAFGLCNAYKHATTHGDAAEKAVAFRNLVKAAGGAEKVAAFCAAVPHPGHSASPSLHPTGAPSPHHPTGRPTSHPSPHHPTGRPTSHPSPHHPTGQPTSHPSPHPTGQPSHS
jgi:hypothetical protein